MRGAGSIASGTWGLGRGQGQGGRAGNGSRPENEGRGRARTMRKRRGRGCMAGGGARGMGGRGAGRKGAKGLGGKGWAWAVEAEEGRAGSADGDPGGIYRGWMLGYGDMDRVSFAHVSRCRVTIRETVRAHVSSCYIKCCAALASFRPWQHNILSIDESKDAMHMPIVAPLQRACAAAVSLSTSLLSTPTSGT